MGFLGRVKTPGKVFGSRNPNGAGWEFLKVPLFFNPGKRFKRKGFQPFLGFIPGEGKFPFGILGPNFGGYPRFSQKTFPFFLFPIGKYPELVKGVYPNLTLLTFTREHYPNPKEPQGKRLSKFWAQFSPFGERPFPKKPSSREFSWLR